jgi:hypothetical protein
MKVNDALNESVAVYKKHFVAFTVATLIFIFGSLFIITIAPLSFGLIFMALKAIRGEDVEIADVFKGFNYFIVSWVLMIVEVLAITIGFIFLIIPGFLLSILLMYSGAILINENRGPIDSLQRSFSIGRSNFQFTLIVGVIYLALSTLGIFSFIVTIFTTPLAVILTTAAYLKIKEKED